MTIIITIITIKHHFYQLTISTPDQPLTTINPTHHPKPTAHLTNNLLTNNLFKYKNNQTHNQPQPQLEY